MELREGENILRIYHHHPTPYLFFVLKILTATFPFFLLLFILQNAISTKWYVLGHVIVLGFFAIVIAYYSLVYWLDKLVITNQRIIYVNWQYITVRNESEASLNDIQDIESHENGIFSYFWLLDYGFIIVETASSHTTIDFQNAPNPEGIRQYIYQVRVQ